MEFMYCGDSDNIFNEMDKAREELFLNNDDVKAGMQTMLDRFIAYKALFVWANSDSEKDEVSEGIKQFDEKTLEIAHKIAKFANESFD